MTQVTQQLDLDPRFAFGAESIEAVDLTSWVERCALWLGHLEDLSRWNQYFLGARRAADSGLGSLLDRLESGVIAAPKALYCFDRVYLGQLLREFMRQNPDSRAV